MSSNNTEQTLSLKELGDIPSKKAFAQPNSMNLLHDVPVKVSAKLGKTTLTVEEILSLDVDSIIQLETNVGDLVEIYANDILIGCGEIVVVNEDIGVKISQINIDDVLLTLGR